jgi:hypothetical protein
VAATVLAAGAVSAAGAADPPASTAALGELTAREARRAALVRPVAAAVVLVASAVAGCGAAATGASVGCATGITTGAGRTGGGGAT